MVVLFAVLALLSPSQVPATQSERLKALQEMTSSAQLKSMDLILPLITDKDPIIRAAAAKAYLAIPKRWQDRVIARAQEVGHQSSEITEAWQEYSRLMEPHEKNLIYGDWLLRVLNDNERGDRKARRALLLDLLAKTPEDQAYKLDETPYRDMCGEDAPEGYEAIRDTAANEVVGVLEILGDTSNKHRRSLIRCLEMQTQTPRIQNAFANLLSDPVPVIRAEALLKLNQTRKDILLRFSNDPYAVVREAMVFRAYDLGKKERYDLYLRMMHDRAEGVAISAAKGIGLTEDPRFVKDATNLLTSPRKGVVEAAAVAMQESFKPEFIPPLKKALANQKHLGRGQIAFALARLANGNEALFFRDYLSDKDIEVVSHACSALGNAKDKQSIPMLTKLAARKDGDVAFFAAEALRQIKG